MRPLSLIRAPLIISIACILLADSAIAEPVEGESFGSWQTECETDPQARRTGCFIVQNLVLREGGQRVLQLAVGYVESAPEPIALVSLPLGISLPPGARIEVDGTEIARMPIERCEPNGCRAGMKLGDGVLQQFRAGKEVTVTFYDAKREPIAVPLSLDGFTAGLASLKTASP